MVKWGHDELALLRDQLGTPRPMDMDPADTSTLAVVVSRLEDMRTAQEKYEERMMKEIQGLRSELRASHEDKVSRGEWLQRNQTVDSKFDAQGKDIQDVKEQAMAGISEVKQELAAKKSPPAVWISLAVSAAVALWAFFGQIAPPGTGAEDSDTPHVVEQT